MSSSDKNMDMKDSSEASSAAQSGLLALNNLSYTFSRDLSVAVSRTNTTQHFASQVYSPSDTAVCIFNTGSAFIDPRRSYLEIDVQNTSGGDVWFGAGTALNLFRRITWYSRSGVTIEQLDNANQVNFIRLNYEHDSGYLEGPATAFGAAATIGALAWTNGEILRFAVPLPAMSPAFASSNQLWPPQIMSGLRCEIVLESPTIALVAAAAPPITRNYSVQRMQFQTAAFLLSDVSSRVLSQIAASNSLELTINTMHVTLASRQGQAVLNLDSGKSVSRALSAILYEAPGGLSAQDADRMLTIPFNATSFVREFQCRVGSMYFPNAPVSGATARIASPSLYSNTLEAWNKFYQGPAASCSVSEPAFRTGKGVLATTLERSTVLQLAGIPLSNARTLSVNVTWGGSVPSPVNASTILLILNYVSLLRVFNSNTIVEI